jgi:hypothetical protein
MVVLLPGVVRPSTKQQQCRQPKLPIVQIDDMVVVGCWKRLLLLYDVTVTPVVTEASKRRTR